MLTRWMAILGAAVLAGCSSTGGPAAAPDESLERARAAARGGDLQAAEAELLLLLKRDPRNASAHADHASLLARTGREAQAVVGYERSLALDPTNPDALYNLGTLYLRRGEPLEAARRLERALELRPGHVSSYNNVARAYYELGLPELAVAAYEEALALDPDNSTARANLDLLSRFDPGHDPAGAAKKDDS